MSLSAGERISVFEALGIPTVKPIDFYQDLSSKETVNRAMMLYNQDLTLWPYEYSDDAIVAVDTRLAALTAAEESKVKDLVSSWDEISLKSVTVKTDSISLSYDNERARVRRLMKIIIPINVLGGFSADNPAVSIG